MILILSANLITKRNNSAIFLNQKLKISFLTGHSRNVVLKFGGCRLNGLVRNKTERKNEKEKDKHTLEYKRTAYFFRAWDLCHFFFCNGFGW